MRNLASACIALLVVCGCGSAAVPGTTEPTESVESKDSTSAALSGGVVGPHSLSFDFAPLNVFLPAGVAVGTDAIFVGSPFEGSVVALSRSNGTPIGQLPPPPNGFILPFIVHLVGPNTVTVLDAGGFPSPDVNCAQAEFPCPAGPDPSGVAGAAPFLYEYKYSLTGGMFQATLSRTISFASFPGITYGFAEDFVRLPDGGYLVSDAIYGAIWRVAPDGTIEPGIIPKTYAPDDQIPQMAFWNCQGNEPLVKVAGLPFEFSGNSQPGVSPVAQRDGTVYFYTPCTGALYKFPLASLFDKRKPYQRAADIKLVSKKAPDVAVEELLDMTFNPFDPLDPYLYAADALELRVIRIDPRTGARTVVGNNPRLFNWPAALAFAPPLGRSLFVVSNQQHRTWITNNYLPMGEDLTERPYILTETFPLP